MNYMNGKTDEIDIGNQELFCDSFYPEEEEMELLYGDDDDWGMAEDAVIEKYVSLEEGFDITRNHFGYINLEYWAGITGYTVDQIIYRANGKIIWRDPKQVELEADKTIGWVTREQILKGNRIRKLEEAREINERYGGLEEVIKLLEEHLPEEISGSKIHVNLGSTWVLKIENFVADFIAELLDMSVPPKVDYDAYRGKWNIQCIVPPNEVLNNYKYGLPEMSCIRILEHKLNGKPIKVFEQVYSHEKGINESVLNRALTLVAQEKSRDIDLCFLDYCHGNKSNECLLQETYIGQYGYGLCRFDGSYLTLEDASKKINLYKHQKDGVAHIMGCPNVLLAHKVGAGKTNIYSCGIHELIRLGICKKAVVVVPKGNLGEVVKAYQNLFPMDPVMVCRPNKEFAPANRKETLEKIKQADRLIVFITYRSFDMLTMTRKYAFEKKDAQLRECARQIANADNYIHRGRLKAMEKNMIKSVQAYKKAFIDSETACFDELGFDILVVDEAHNYKNITLDYSADTIVGVHSKGSTKADNMLEKVRYIQEQDGRVIFATATPMPNSMADLYAFQLYLQPEELKMCNIYHFNDWVNTFCEEEHDFEVDVDGKNGRFMTRFSRFHNLTELMAMFSEVCDFYQGEDCGLNLPVFKGYTDVVVKKSPELKDYMEELAARTEAIRNHNVTRKEDNLLKVTVQGRLAALHIKLVKPDLLHVAKENKIYVAAQKMAEIYFNHWDKCQIAFSDISTPKEGFNVYDELKRELIDLGVEPGHIAFIHEAATESQRSNMEKRFNKGEIRILVGSTAKLGTGTNVQERLYAIHHLDVPWRPADMVQREGRIIRPGNTCKEVQIFRYITEGSFDAYTYQILENKQKFIAQFLSGSLSVLHREESDCADTILSYAEIKALAIGNPLIKERVEVSNRLEHARINQRQKKKELLNLEELKRRLPEMMIKQKKRISNVKKDISYYASCKEPVKREERRSFGEELLYALKDNVMCKKERLFNEYQGFDVILPKYMDNIEPYVILEREGSNRYSVIMDGKKEMGVCQRLDHCLDNLDKELLRHKNKLQELAVQQREAQKELERGNPYDEEVAALAEYLKEIDDKLREDTAA